MTGLKRGVGGDEVREIFN